MVQLPVAVSYTYTIFFIRIMIMTENQLYNFIKYFSFNLIPLWINHNFLLFFLELTAGLNNLKWLSLVIYICLVQRV